MKKYELAIVGASGLVGQKIISVLKDYGILNNSNLSLYVSKNSAGKILEIDGEQFDLNLLNENILDKKFDIVFFSAGESVSEKWAKLLVKNGAYVIDNTNAFRRDDSVPLVVPEINIDKINNNTKIISNPNCSTIQLSLAIKSLLDYARYSENEIEKIVVSTYQSVSGAGKEALSDLENNTTIKIKEPIKNNVFLKIGDISENGFCTEENKIMFELNKVCEKNLSICASTVRVPISYCHSESVYVKFSNNVDFNQIFRNYYKYNLKIIDDIIMPKDVVGGYDTYISRLRKFSENEIAFFVVADNLLRGAAYNAVMIAKYILENLI